MAATNGYRFGSGFKGSKIHWVGADESVYQYTDLASAVAAAQNNDVIMVEPGTYTLTSKLDVNKPLTIKGMRSVGDKGVIITSASSLTTELVDVDLVAQSAAAEVVFEDIAFVAAATNKQAVHIDNGSMGNYKLTVRFERCNIEAAAATTTEYALVVDHTGVGASNEIVVKVNGSGTQSVHGVNFDIVDAQDSLEANQIVFSPKGTLKAINTSADAVAATLLLRQCVFPHELATSGGNAAQIAISVGSVSVTGTTYAAIDTNDLAGSHTEVIA